MSTNRKKIPLSIQRQVLHDAGYRCANPACRTIITIEIHHLDQVSNGGDNVADNLLALCPNCHTLHHNGTIPLESLKTWKYLLISLNEGFDKKSIDVLLAMQDIEQLGVTGDGFIHLAGLVNGGYIRTNVHATTAATGGAAVFNLRLTEKGKAFVAAWKAGNQRDAVNWKPE